MEDYSVLLCRNQHDGQLCDQAVPLDRLQAHLNPCRAFSSKSNIKHRHFDHGYKEFKNTKATDFINRVAAEYPSVIRNVEELSCLKPGARQQGPIIELLPPDSGRYCLYSGCKFATWSEGTASDHWALHRKESDTRSDMVGRSGSVWKTKFQVAPLGIQSFSMDNGVRSYFCVPSSHLPPQVKKGSTMTTTEVLQKSYKGLVPPCLPFSQKTDAITMLPFFQKIGAADYIEGYNCISLVDLVSLPREGEPLLAKLRMAAIHRFMTACKEISRGNHILRTLLLSSAP
jgi:hypothetical protein